MKNILVVAVVILISNFALGEDFYVSAKTGSNGNDASKAQPLKNIEKALKKAKAGDTVHVAEGNYFGLRGKGYLEVKEPVTLLGGYSTDFSKRDMLKHQTFIQPDNGSGKKSRKALITLLKSGKGQHFKIEGFILDMGMRNSYDGVEGKPKGVDTGMLILPPSYNKARDVSPTVTEQCIYIANPASAGDVTIENNVIANCAKFGIQGGHKQGTFVIRNNVFVSNRMGAIEVFGTGGKKGPQGPTEKDGHVEISHNTILFNWSRLKDFNDMGYGVRIMTKLSYDIKNNIIAANIYTGIDHTRFNKYEWIKINDNVLGLNKQGDLMLSEPGNVQMERVNVGDFADLDFDEVGGNRGEMPKLPIDQAYLEGYLAARYQEKADYDPDSPANQIRAIFGLNKQGKLETNVSMFGNRYPVAKALELFGAAKGVGAQSPL